MVDSFSWAADQKYEENIRGRRAYCETPEYKEMLERKAEYDRLMEKPLPPVTVKQLEFLMEKPESWRYRWPEHCDVAFYTPERLVKLKTIHGFYGGDL